jgi:hypothetical protein
LKDRGIGARLTIHGGSKYRIEESLEVKYLGVSGIDC